MESGEKYDRTTASKPLQLLGLEAGVGIGRFSPRLRGKNAHFLERINLNLLNQTKPILTGLVSVLVSAPECEASPDSRQRTVQAFEASRSTRNDRWRWQAVTVQCPLSSDKIWPTIWLIGCARPSAGLPKQDDESRIHVPDALEFRLRVFLVSLRDMTIAALCDRIFWLDR